jgi:hypothetical protein
MSAVSAVFEVIVLLAKRTVCNTNAHTKTAGDWTKLESWHIKVTPKRKCPELEGVRISATA